MNFTREIQTSAELLQIVLGRFQLLPQHCPAALHLGFKFIVRYVHYHPNFPFTVNQRGFPFREESEAIKFYQQRIESAFANISEFTEEKPRALREEHGQRMRSEQLDHPTNI